MIFLFNPFSWEELRRDAMYRSIGYVGCSSRGSSNAHEYLIVVNDY